MRYRLVVEGPWPNGTSAEDMIADCKRTYLSPRHAVYRWGAGDESQRLELLDDEGSVLASWSEEG